MQFRTEIPLSLSENKIDYQSKIFLMGSCFAENMGEKFEYYKFQTLVNPFGIIFNTASLSAIFQRIAGQKKFTENDVFFHNDLWHSFEVHSKLSHHEKNDCINNLNDLLKATESFLKESTHVTLTLGTSWVYRNIETKSIVANCHKVPQNQFEKVLLSSEENFFYLQDCIALLKKINPQISIIITISPVRHIKDGFFENNVSKANLFSAVNQLLTTDKELNYFPSYEIMMDELRDYRFYSEDLLHPNSIATDYIWEQFSKVFFNEKTQKTIQEVATIQKSLAHKPFNPTTDSHKEFQKKLQTRINLLTKQFPHITF